MTGSVFSNSLSKKDKCVKIETLSGVEAEVIRAAADRFLAEGLNAATHEYAVSIYLDNDEYVVLFEKTKVSLNTVHFEYEVTISARTLKVMQAQFLRLDMLVSND